jgi:L-asparaginase
MPKPKTRSKSKTKSKTRSKRKKQAVAKVYILYTGGTIGMLHNKKKGLIPVKGTLNRLINNMDIDKKLRITYHIEQTKKLIDSSNLQIGDMKIILEKLFENYSKYDSFIIIHGTDTLAYTASMLSFFLKDWNKPVIVTGSQIPLFEFRNDATRNIIDSVIVSLMKINEVMIVFGGKILRGNRSSKYSSTDFVAYKSPNYGPIGEIGVYLNIYKNKLLQNVQPYDIYPSLPRIPSNWNFSKWNNDIKIYTLTLSPEQNAMPLDAMIALNPQAIILRTYGIGNAPVGDKNFMDSIETAVRKNILVVNTTQCVNGGVNMTFYNTGKMMKEKGVISSFDMTPETVYMKLFYLFQVLGTKNIPLIKKYFKTDIAGELTMDKTKVHVASYLKSYFNTFQEL